VLDDGDYVFIQGCKFVKPIIGDWIPRPKAKEDRLAYQELLETYEMECGPIPSEWKQ
jgi:hypothetical protein